MANLTAIIGADTSKFVEEVKSARYMLNKFVKDTEQASNTARENASASKEQVQAYSRVISQLEKVASGTMNTKQQQQALAAQIKELKVQWQGLSDAAKSGDFGKSLSDTLKTATAELDNLKTKLASVDDVKPSGNLKRELRETTTELTNLTAQYRAMTAAEKVSAQGTELAAKMDELREKAGGLTDTIGDVQQEIQTMASDTPNLDVFNDALGIGADLLSTYSSVIAKVTGDEESLKNAISTVMAVQSAANLMTKVTNALQSSSAIMLKTRAIQEGAAAVAIKIRTAAEGKGTIATKAATAAQAAFNLIAKANPYVLLATAVLGVGAALVAFSKHLDESTEAEKRAQKEAEALKEKQEHLRKQSEELSETSANAKVKFYELQEQWKNLKTEAEKKEWISKNQSAFNQLGLSVNSVKTAEDVFVNNTKAVCDALLARAVAAKQAEQAANDLIELDKKRSEKSVASGDYYTTYHKGDKISDKEAQAAGVRTNKERLHTSGAGYYAHATVDDLSDEEVNKVNQYRARQAAQRRKQLQKQYDDEEQVIRVGYQKAIKTVMDSEHKLAALGDKPKATGGGGTTSSKTNKDKPTYAKESLSDLEAQLSQLQKDYKDGLLPELSKDNYKKAIDLLEKQIKNKRIELGLEVELPEGSIAKIDEEISKKQRELKLAIDDASRKKIQDEIDALIGQKEAIMLYLKPVVDDKDIAELSEDISEHLATTTKVTIPVGASKTDRKIVNAQNNAESLKQELDFQRSIIANHKEEYELILQKSAANATLTDNESRLVDIYKNAQKQVEELGDAYSEAAEQAEELQKKAELKQAAWDSFKGGVSALGNLNSSFKDTKDTWENLGESWEDMDDFEKVTSVFEASISTIQNVIKAFESISQVVQMFQMISTLFTQQKIANDQQETQSEMNKLGVKQASALAGATESGSSLGFPMNIIAIAMGIAAVVAAFAMVFSCFAEGGIVGGQTSIGDYNIARVNKGEMILNGTQQKRLFNLLDGTDSRNGSVVGEGGNVQFKIKGNNLYGVLRNHNLKSNRVGK